MFRHEATLCSIYAIISGSHGYDGSFNSKSGHQSVCSETAASASVKITVAFDFDRITVYMHDDEINSHQMTHKSSAILQTQSRFCGHNYMCANSILSTLTKHATIILMYHLGIMSVLEAAQIVLIH